MSPDSVPTGGHPGGAPRAPADQDTQARRSDRRITAGTALLRTGLTQALLAGVPAAGPRQGRAGTVPRRTARQPARVPWIAASAGLGAAPLPSARTGGSHRADSGQ